jgi:heme-degrading monooxygenase HmoA
MKRRTYLKSVVAGAGLIASERTGTLKAAPGTGEKIELHVDLAVDPAREEEMLRNFRTIFRPTATRQPGYISVEMLKLRSAVQGSAPANVNYRFVLTYASEELRQKWVASEAHQKVWPTIEKTLSSTIYTVLLFNIT